MAEPTYATSLREILAESLKEKGETFDDVETTTHQSQLNDPIPCDCCGDLMSLPNWKKDPIHFKAWTKNRVYFFLCNNLGYVVIDSVPRNPPPSA